MQILVTGGAGYIGSHLVLALLRAGHDVRVLDDLRAGHAQALDRVAELAGRSAEFVRADVADVPRVVDALDGVHLVYHLAGSKAVGESMGFPERYFQNNLGGMAGLLTAMRQVGVDRIIFSSSAAVYGAEAEMPLSEGATHGPANPYALTKAQGEQMLAWMAERCGWSAVSLRYFNPVGADASGRIGECCAEPTNLVPRVLQALTGDIPHVAIFGEDYDTPDGTCLRDYIHISDLADAHLAALDALERPGHHIYNVGTGRPYSVREVIDGCSRVAGRPVPFVRGDRRPGDAPVAVADPRRFADDLGFRAERGLDQMLESAWRWVTENPRGYAG
ncbi:MAG: UDP-glucose 4-epimerase GalE [Alphaproteobacteria bacterium]|nr:UDP-glucose 4-epimerase GalE [Alphaproteobacteria bacterium]